MGKPIQHRAHSLLRIKAMDEDAREIVGIATTPTPDRAGDIVEPKGAEFQLPIPLLWQHDSRAPIGHVLEAKVTNDGIEVRCKFAKIDEPGKLKDRLDEAWQSVKSGLVQGLSIGFKDLEASRISDTYSYRFLKWLWLELSVVTIPMNGECSITAVKAADDLILRAMSGRSGGDGVVRLRSDGSSPSSRPDVSGASSPQRNSQGTTNMNLTETKAALEARRKAATERMASLMTSTSADGGIRTFSASEAEEYDDLGNEVKTIDEHLARVKTHESIAVSTATPIVPTTGTHVDIGQRGIVAVTRRVEKGIPFTRYAIALARAQGNLMQAAEIAKRYDADTPEVGISIKAAVAAGSTTDTTWAGPLVQYNDMVADFIEYLRPQTILGRLSDLTRVPFNTRIPRQTAGTSGSFVGEGSPKPVGKLDFDNVTLPWAKCSCIVVLSDELVKMSNPSAEALVRRDLAAGAAQYLDRRFIDPAYAGVANVSPASISNSIAPRAASGTTLAALDDDVAYVMRAFTTAELTLLTGVWIMSPQTAINLSMMRTSQDQKAFPDLNMRGGVFYGLPVITSNNVVASGSPTDGHIYLVDQSEILLADDGQMMIDMSSQASLQMSDSPSAGAQSLVSLWQNGLTGVKLDRWVYWTKRRSAACQHIDNVNYN